jgi:hypothetical protein
MQAHRRRRHHGYSDRGSALIGDIQIDELNTPIHHLEKAYARCIYLSFQKAAPLTISSIFGRYEAFIDECAELSIGLIIYHSHALVCEESRESNAHLTVIDACKQALLARSVSTTDVCTCPKKDSEESSYTKSSSSRRRSSSHWLPPFPYGSDDDTESSHPSDEGDEEEESEDDERGEDDDSASGSSNDVSSDDGQVYYPDVRRPVPRQRLSFKRRFKPGGKRVRFEDSPPSSVVASTPVTATALKTTPSTVKPGDDAESDGDEVYEEEGEEATEEEIAVKITEIRQRMIDDRAWLAKTKGVTESHISDIFTPELEKEMDRINRAYVKKFYLSRAPPNFKDGDPIRISLKSNDKKDEKVVTPEVVVDASPSPSAVAAALDTPVANVD